MGPTADDDSLEKRYIALISGQTEERQYIAFGFHTGRSLTWPRWTES